MTRPSGAGRCEITAMPASDAIRYVQSLIQVCKENE